MLVSHLPQEERDGAETVRSVEDAGRRALRAPGDLCDEGYCTSLVDRAFSSSAASTSWSTTPPSSARHDSIADITTADFDTTFRTNVYTMFWLCRAALPRMQAGGAIINTASIQAYDPEPAVARLRCDQGRHHQLHQRPVAARHATGRARQRCCPWAGVDTLIPSTMDQEKVRQFGGQTAFGRPAQPVELAPLFVFLASNEARFVTGEVYGATGGQTPV